MSIVWEGDDSGILLTEKQLESIFILSKKSYGNNLQDNSQFVKEAHETDAPINIQLASHFYSWLKKIEGNINSINDSPDVQLMEYISNRKQHCSNILDVLREISTNLEGLKLNYLSVSEKTNSLHSDCEHLLQEQNKLSETASIIDKILLNFLNIDVVEAELDSKGFVATADKFQSIFTRLDKSIAFFKKHLTYKDSESYLARATDALTKALDILSASVNKIIDRTVSELLDLHDVITPDNSFILLYGRFRSQGPKIRAIMCLVEERIHLAEYKRALTTCHDFYLKRREELLVSVARSGIADLFDKYHSDHCALLRTSGAFMVHMCEDETRLFSQFFAPQLSTALSQMLTKLCSCLYDAFRPLIIHMNHVEILTELCDILKFDLIDGNVTNNPLDMSAFAELCASLLADTQERLVYRTHIYVRQQILGYQPSPGDLTYPEKLEMMNEIAKQTAKSESNRDSVTELDGSSTSDRPETGVNPGPNMSLSPADLHGMWYPTVRRALDCLSKLSRCLEGDSFRGLAQECVSMCVQSLMKASDLISANRTPADGQLFQIKHLLILREQMAPFNIEFSVKETTIGFSNYTSAVKGIWNHRGAGLLTLDRSNSLLRLLLETPNVIEIEVDSRRQLDGQLKHVCETFIEQNVRRLVGEIPDFLERANAVLAAPGARLVDQPFAGASTLQTLVASAHRSICVALGRTSKPKKSVDASQSGQQHHQYGSGYLIHSLKTYLANPDTESLVLRRIQAGVIAYWRTLIQLMVEQYDAEDRMIIACPTESQIRLLFQDTRN